MILLADKFKDSCKIILQAVDYNELSQVTEALQVDIKNNILSLKVTNGDYFIEVADNIDSTEELHFTVNALLFLKLISQITTEQIEFNIFQNNLQIIGNGKYILPMIYEEDHILNLPMIPIGDVSDEFILKRDNFNLIYNFNSKELLKGKSVRPVQNLYYFDNTGCITFMTGACYNKFITDCKCKFFITDKIVKLLKLFTTDIHVMYSHYCISDNIIQTRVLFYNSLIKLTAILPESEDLFQSVPVEPIAEMCTQEYPYHVSLDVKELNQSINRLSIFNSVDHVSLKPYIKINITNDNIELFDCNSNSSESINIPHVDIDNFNYSTLLNYIDLSLTLNSLNTNNIYLFFGNKRNVLLKLNKTNIIIPECSEI